MPKARYGGKRPTKSRRQATKEMRKKSEEVKSKIRDIVKEKDTRIKRVLMEITMDEDSNLEWNFSPDLNKFNMYAVYGLLDLIREELKEDFREEFEKTED